MVVDTSILLAIFFAEPHAQWAAEKLREHAAELRMSTVNLAEVLIRVKDRQPQMYEEIRSEIFAGGLRFVAPDTPTWLRTLPAGR
ncbi:MAG TPA: type II toxin-antitoxin system VapC family toxin [Thermoanaerobaculia bacterium]|nr:type II toxin-antitoxin system VapC family toxin [Thermoanaerobaculia bacterium]